VGGGLFAGEHAGTLKNQGPGADRGQEFHPLGLVPDPLEERLFFHQALHRRLGSRDQQYVQGGCGFKGIFRLHLETGAAFNDSGLLGDGHDPSLLDQSVGDVKDIQGGDEIGTGCLLIDKDTVGVIHRRTPFHFMVSKAVCTP
jgi:hypothetical protein